MPAPKIHATNADKQRAWRERQRSLRNAGNMAAVPAPAGPCNIPPRKRWKALRDQAEALLTTLQEEMQAYYDDRSDDWKDGDRAGELQEELNTLEELLDTLRELP